MPEMVLAPPNKVMPKKKKIGRPTATGFHDQKGRQGWFLKEATLTYEDWSFYTNGVCMETRRFYVRSGAVGIVHED
jgi:hypothetical protein